MRLRSARCLHNAAKNRSASPKSSTCDSPSPVRRERAGVRVGNFGTAITRTAAPTARICRTVADDRSDGAIAHVLGCVLDMPPNAAAP